MTAVNRRAGAAELWMPEDRGGLREETDFFPLPEASACQSRWQAENRALGRLVGARRSHLKEAIRTARDIRKQVAALLPGMDSLCRSTCPWCPEPCCIVTRVWIDFQDLLFWHLLAMPIPAWPLASKLEEKCRYLGARGCLLPRLLRPWGCTQYLCATQRRRFENRDAPGLARMDGALEKIRQNRFRMEEMAVQGIKR